MKNLPPLVVALMLLPFTAVGSSLPPVQFLDNDLPEVRQMAAREGKLYLIHFTADWVMPCQWMESHTFTDGPLSDYLNENYLALRADIDNPKGQALKKQFEVNILPSILVFSSQGQLLGRHEGAMEPEVLLEELKAYDRPANRIRAALVALDENILASPQPILRISRPALIPDEVAQPVVSAAERPDLPANPTRAEATPVPGQSPSAAQRSFFTIQVGVFSSYDNAIRQCSTMESQLGEKTEIAPFQLNGQGLYKVFLGRFDSQEKAAAFLNGLREKNIDGFVKIVDNQG